MTTTLATADPHFSSNPRDSYRWKFLEETLPALIAEHAVERVLVLGDLTEAKTGHSAELVNRLSDGFARIAELADVVLHKGNHDYLAEDVPFFRYMGHLPRVRWINEPTRLKLRGLGDCMFFPHSHKWSECWAAAGGPGMQLDWFFCHQTFCGADLGYGRRAEGTAAPFPKGARVVSGDVHSPQKIGPVIYVGAPYLIDFGDAYEPRVLLLEGGKARSVPVPGPQKRLMVLSGRDPLAALPGKLKHPLNDALPQINAGDVVKTRVELPAGSEYSRADIRASVREWAEKVGVELYAVEVIAPKTGPTRARAVHRSTDAELVRAYAKRMKKGKATVAAGLKIAEE